LGTRDDFATPRRFKREELGVEDSTANTRKRKANRTATAQRHCGREVQEEIRWRRRRCEPPSIGTSGRQTTPYINAIWKSTIRDLGVREAELDPEFVYIIPRRLHNARFDHHLRGGTVEPLDEGQYAIELALRVSEYDSVRPLIDQNLATHGGQERFQLL